ncbi:MAG: DUF3810 domain-containing protein [Clostridia bacterium]|nr:DUF3810 domain-containing protein [Clostridia bacterium]
MKQPAEFSEAVGSGKSLQRARPKRDWARHTRLLWLILLPMPFLLRNLLADDPEWVESYFVQRFFPVWSQPFRTFSTAIPFSLTELAVVLIPVVLVVWLAAARRAVHKHEGQRFFRRSLGVFGWIVALAAWQFVLLHGIAYTREPVSRSFILPSRARPAQDVAAALAWTARQAEIARSACQEDAAGVFILQRPIRATLDAAGAGYVEAGEEWPLLALVMPPARPKPVLLSHYWSYTGITGLYNPLWVEANVNIDQPAYLLPAAASHEIAHTMGFAREDEAGFVSFLTGIAHPDPDYRYSSYADATIRLLNSLAAVDPELYRQTASLVSDGVWRDIAAANEYWQQFEGPVQETSSTINDAYLKANLQTDGVHSYGRMVDLLLAWYEKNQTQLTLPEALPTP